MQVYRVSVTTLEKFRRYMAETSSFDTEESLVEALEGKFEGNDKTKTGHAFHAIIEKPQAITRSSFKGEMYAVSEGIGFPEQAYNAAMEYRSQHPLMVNEIPVSKIYNAGKHQILVSGRVDAIEGVHVRDAKTKYRAPSDISDYTDSCQWKFYLDILGLKVFHYDVFEVKRFKELVPHSDGICYLEKVEIVPHDAITCLSYLTMNAELCYLTERFIEYIEYRNLFHLLKTVDNGKSEQVLTNM